MTKKQKIGHLGEKIAQKYLAKKGYKFLQNNYFCNEGEIDLIFYDNKIKQTVFVEVKTRTTKDFGLAEDSFDFRKQERMQNAIASYVEKAGIFEYRIDLVAIYLNLIKRKAKIIHYKSAM